MKKQKYEIWDEGEVFNSEKRWRKQRCHKKLSSRLTEKLSSKLYGEIVDYIINER
jgi:hypothetical protein